jgi:hypothetical protein
MRFFYKITKIKRRDSFKNQKETIGTNHFYSLKLSKIEFIIQLDQNINKLFKLKILKVILKGEQLTFDF